jgi:hypothetical protein
VTVEAAKQHRALFVYQPVLAKYFSGRPAGSMLEAGGLLDLAGDIGQPAKQNLND